MRGTPPGHAHELGLIRFIPAFAGNASPRSPPASTRPVHPRVCGERSPGGSSACGASGSSPRLRGTRGASFRRGQGQRFIPAFAGNAWKTSRRTSRPSVHPRVCGERFSIRKLIFYLDGSSPRLRGTLTQRADKRHPQRFIPAFAGNATWFRIGRRGPPVHPRVCGERGSTGRLQRATIGSSPRLRGTHAPPAGADGRKRFIPAFAGNAYSP